MDELTHPLLDIASARQKRRRSIARTWLTACALVIATAGACAIVQRAGVVTFDRAWVTKEELRQEVLRIEAKIDAVPGKVLDLLRAEKKERP